MKHQYLGVIFTNHALNRLYNREVNQSKAYKTLKKPDKKEAGKTIGSYKFSRDFGDYILQLVAKKNDKKQWIVLTCWVKEKFASKKQKNGFWGRLLDWILG